VEGAEEVGVMEGVEELQREEVGAGEEVGVGAVGEERAREALGREEDKGPEGVEGRVRGKVLGGVRLCSLCSSCIILHLKVA
jgi:hypothetical protein